MARYMAITKLSPSRIIEKAAKHFGDLSGGMKVTSKTSSTLCLESPDGYITVSVCPSQGKKNEMDIETNQFDNQVREFLRLL